MRRRVESNFRIEIFAKVRNGQKGKFGAYACPKCTFGSDWPNMSVLIQGASPKQSTRPITSSAPVLCQTKKSNAPHYKARDIRQQQQ
jgi:hypothetical protein